MWREIDERYDGEEWVKHYIIDSEAGLRTAARSYLEDAFRKLCRINDDVDPHFRRKPIPPDAVMVDYLKQQGEWDLWSGYSGIDFEDGLLIRVPSTLDSHPGYGAGVTFEAYADGEARRSENGHRDADRQFEQRPADWEGRREEALRADSRNYLEDAYFKVRMCNGDYEFDGLPKPVPPDAEMVDYLKRHGEWEIWSAYSGIGFADGVLVRVPRTRESHPGFKVDGLRPVVPASGSSPVAIAPSPAER